MKRHANFSPTCLVLSVFFSLMTVLFIPQSSRADMSGTILETMDAAGYTYIHMDSGQEKLWVAIPQSKVVTGEQIIVLDGMEMKDFRSNSLDRTFGSIIFSPGIAGSVPASPQGKSAEPKPEKDQDDSFAAALQEERGSSGAAKPIEPVQGSTGSMGAIAPFAEINVEKAEGENGYTVSELFEKATALNGKKVRVRGQLVKYNANIMGKNWLHLQDGSGDPMKNTHDLVVTTTEEVSGPKIITIEGTLAAEKDFGAGYKYTVIIEDSTVLE